MELQNHDGPARIQKLTRTRIISAIAVGVIADGLQILSGMLGWIVVDQVIDVIAAVLVGRLIGFHWLLLPTFVLEAVPIVDDFPTWTVCVIAVIAIHRRPPSHRAMRSVER